MLITNQFRKPVIAVISALFIALFTYAATSKLIDFQQFNVELQKSPLLVPVSGFVAIVIPLSELTIAVMLIIERSRLLAFYASFALMTLFTAYLVMILNFSDYVPCTCGGVLEYLSWKTHILFNLVFVLLAVLAIFLYDDKNLVLQYDRDRRTPV